MPITISKTACSPWNSSAVKAGVALIAATCLMSSGLHQRSVHANHEPADMVGEGTIVQDFDGASGVGVNVFGTRMRLVSKRTLIESKPMQPVFNYHIRHLLKTRQTQGPLYYGLASMYNTDPTHGMGSDSPATHFHPYYCIVMGNPDQPLCGLGSSDNIPLTDSPTYDYQVAKFWIDSCIPPVFPSIICNNDNKVIWEFKGTDGFNDFSIQIAFSMNQDHPFSVLQARHGVHTTSTNSNHDAHIVMSDNAYFPAEVCGGGCAGSWGSGIPLTPSLFANSAQTGVMVYKDAANATAYHVCFGLSPESRCGCERCVLPAFQSEQWRWLPGIEYPLTYEVQGFGIRTASMRAEVEDFADELQAAVGSSYPLLQEVTDGTPDILITTDDNWDPNEWSQTAEFREAIVPGMIADWQCDPGTDGYEQFTSGVVAFNTTTFELSASNRFTSVCPSDPRCPGHDPNAANPVPTLPLSVIRHELGHALGVGHHGSCSVPNPPPPGGAHTFDYLCSPLPEGWVDVRLGFALTDAGVHATKCLMFR